MRIEVGEKRLLWTCRGSGGAATEKTAWIVGDGDADDEGVYAQGGGKESRFA